VIDSYLSGVRSSRCKLIIKRHNNLFANSATAIEQELSLMMSTYFALILTTLVGLAVSRISDRGDEVKQAHGDFIERAERE
jgi:hypothetical protein